MMKVTFRKVYLGLWFYRDNAHHGRKAQQQVADTVAGQDAESSHSQHKHEAESKLQAGEAFYSQSLPPVAYFLQQGWAS